ncbi:MAG: ABC transporter substrate-binding protein [Trueperaceae bacterium]|jgi:NitT/TauT family transport system substrate-binding protein|nr:ABC transporter substrate-binding protein [Trueperaceae bacterium]
MKTSVARLFRTLSLAAVFVAGVATAQLTPEEAAAQYDLDLSGTSITTTSSLAGALLMPQAYMLDMLEAWGAEVEIVTLTNTSGVQALIANRSNLAPHGADELIIGAAQGAELTAIGSPQSKINYVLAGQADVASVADLEGRTIGMSGPAGFDALLTRFSLADEGLDPERDVSFVQIGGSPDRAAALLAGRVDAVTIGLDDWFDLAEKTDDARVVQYMSEVVPDFATELYFSRAEYIDANPDLALAIACGNLESNRWANEHRDAFLAYTVEQVPGTSEAAVLGLYDAAMDVGMWPTTPEGVLSTAGMQGLMEAMLETGDITSPVQVADYIDISFLEDAAALGCGQ